MVYGHWLNFSFMHIGIKRFNVGLGILLLVFDYNSKNLVHAVLSVETYMLLCYNKVLFQNEIQYLI